MEAVLNENLFNGFASKVEKKLKVLWPAKGTTAPTESNMVTILGNLLENENNAAFTEVPVTIDGRGGRIDLLAINEKQTDIDT